MPLPSFFYKMFIWIRLIMDLFFGGEILYEMYRIIFLFTVFYLVIGKTTLFYFSTSRVNLPQLLPLPCSFCGACVQSNFTV